MDATFTLKAVLFTIRRLDYTNTILRFEPTTFAKVKVMLVPIELIYY